MERCWLIQQRNVIIISDHDNDDDNYQGIQMKCELTQIISNTICRCCCCCCNDTITVSIRNFQRVEPSKNVWLSLSFSTSHSSYKIEPTAICVCAILICALPLPPKLAMVKYFRIYCVRYELLELFQWRQQQQQQRKNGIIARNLIWHQPANDDDDDNDTVRLYYYYCQFSKNCCCCCYYFSLAKPACCHILTYRTNLERPNISVRFTSSGNIAISERRRRKESKWRRNTGYGVNLRSGNMLKCRIPKRQ